MEPKAKTSYTCKLTAEQGDQLRQLLDSKGYSFREIPHALFAAQQEKLNVVFYDTRQLLVQGKETESFVKFLLEPEILGFQALTNTSQRTRSPYLSLIHI